jgi:hypothetical protein
MLDSKGGYGEQTYEAKGDSEGVRKVTRVTESR